MKIGVLGGTFDPPHVGHIKLAEKAVLELGLDRVLWIPAFIPPHKELSRDSAGTVHRLEMTRIAASLAPVSEVWDGEIKRGGKSYTSDTLDCLKNEMPGDELVLIVGADQFLNIENWHEAEKILKGVTLAAAARTSKEEGSLRLHARRLESEYGARCRVLCGTAVEVSSSEIRAGDKHELVPIPVRGYIADNALYQMPVDALESAVLQRESAKRASHTRYVAELALSLAVTYHADRDLIYRAAVMHDITKGLSFDEQLKIIEKYGIIPNYDPSKFPSLLHSFTGALIARFEYFLPPAVTRVIERHTLGSCDMTLEEKIVFVADKTERSRPYPDAAPIREQAFSDLDGAVYECLKRTAYEIERKGGQIHPDLFRIMQNYSPQKEEKP